MCCHKEIHNEYKKIYNECPFCREKLEETKSTETKCCEHPNIINNSQILCTNCGTRAWSSNSKRVC